MNERVKVLLYTVVASVALWFALDRFLGGTEEAVAKLDIRDAAHLDAGASEGAPARGAEPFGADAAPREPAAASAVTDVAGPADRTPDSRRRRPVAEGGRDGERAAAPAVATTQAEGSGRLSGAADAAARPDSDADIAAAVQRERARLVVERMSEEEAALLARMDEDLLRGRPPTRALDVALVDCAAEADLAASVRARDELVAAGATQTLAAESVGVLFRHGSAAIKGRSLARLDGLVERFRLCEDEGALRVARNPQGRIDADERLATRREEELKYYLLQRRVPATAIRIGSGS